ncbi:MAG TPA: hypothetical protein VGF67_14155 [Ktedonobacteraceae bacterium]|jgi:hypothetical protein
MGKKLLVITAGTEAASVGQEIEKQMRAHPSSELQVMVRYLDTAYLPNRYGSLHSQEWFQMSIDPRHMRAIYHDIDEHPEIATLLFPGLLPGTDQSGGGAIRYNGAGAVEIQREKLRKWLSSSLADLAGWGQGETTISIALIISAVGATGSGSLEHLLDLVVDAANYAGVKSTTQSTVRCDVYILQPGKKYVTDLGLANTLALYAELAASQLSLQKTQGRHYQGRKIMVGWGSNFILSSIDQLKEAAASLVRLSTDTTTAFSAEYQEREVDNHVLRELDPISGLPMHLSLATVVTINTGTLVEQVIRRDTERLIDQLVLGQSDNRQPGALLASLARALAGADPRSRYGRLLAFLAENSGYAQMRENLENVLREPGTAEGKQQTLLQYYHSAQNQLRQNQRSFIDRGHMFVSEALEAFNRARREMISIQGFSLNELRADLRFLEQTLLQIHRLAIEDTGRNHTNEDEVQRLNEELQKARLSRSKQERLRELKDRMIMNLSGLLQEVARDAALVVLDELERYSLNVGLQVEKVLQRQRKEKARQEARAMAQGQFVLDNSHPLHLMALDTSDEARLYTEKISILGSSQRKPIGNASSSEQLADFRAWLIQQSDFEALFEGDSEHLADTVQTYVRQRVKEAVGQYKLIDILLVDGEERLIHKLREASSRAISLVSFAPAFAPDLREAWYVSADFRTAREELAETESDYPEDRAKRAKIEKALKKAFTSGDCKLLKSRDPSEIALFYYVDGLPLSAIEDLKGRCLEAFLSRRKRWYQQQKELNNGNAPQFSIGGLNQRVGVPVYSGHDAEQRVIETGIIRRLYEVRGSEVGSYRAEDIPELGDVPLNASATARNGNGSTPMPGAQQANSDANAYSQGYRGSASTHNGQGTGQQSVQEQEH